MIRTMHNYKCIFIVIRKILEHERFCLNDLSKYYTVSDQTDSAI